MAWSQRMRLNLTAYLLAMLTIFCVWLPAAAWSTVNAVNAGEVFLPTGVDAQYSAAIDTTTGYGYFGTSGADTTGYVSMINLQGATPTVVSSAAENIPNGIYGMLGVTIDTSSADPTKHYLYVGTCTGQVLKMSPGTATTPPQVLAKITPTSNGAAANIHGLIDASQGYAYFLSNGATYAKVLRVNLSTFTDAGTVQIPLGENAAAGQINSMRYGAIDTVNHYLYLTTSAVNATHNSDNPDSPEICKINLQTAFKSATGPSNPVNGTDYSVCDLSSTVAGAGISRAGFNNPVIDEGIVIDAVHGYAYIATYNCDSTNSNLNLNTWPYNQSIVARITLGAGVTFPAKPVADILTMQVGERDMTCGFLDPANGNIYFGTDNTYPAHVYMIHVGDGTQPMSEVGRLNLNPGTAIPYPPAGLVDGVTHVGSDATQYGEIYLRAGAIDLTHNRLYFGTDSTPGQVVQININQPQPSITLTAPNGGEQWPAGSSHVITWTSAAVTGTVKLELYKGGALNSLLADNVANNGSYNWSIPAGQAAGTDYRVKISVDADATVNGQSAANFAVTAAAPAAPWPMFMHDVRHTGLSPVNGPANANTQWVYNNPNTGGSFQCSPAVGADGTLYTGSWDKNMYAFNPNGTVKWSFPTNNFIVRSVPALGADGTVYFGTNDKIFHALHPDGTQKWAYTAPGGFDCAAAIGTDGSIYVGCSDKNLYAFNPDGTVRWTFLTGNVIFCNPAIGQDGTIYIGSADASLYAVNPDGTKKWSFATGSTIEAAPTIGADGTIYVGSYDKKFYALNPNGTLKWSYTGADTFRSGAAIAADGTIYAQSYEGTLHAFAADGTHKWGFNLGPSAEASPVVGADGTIYVGGNQTCTFYAVNPDGTQKWSCPVGHTVASAASFGADGTLYLGTGKQLIAFGKAPTPTLTLTAPAGGEQWPAGSSHVITWTSAAVTGTVKLELYKGGALNSLLADNVANNGSYNWSIPAGQAAGADYRVKISADADATVNGQSAGDFAVTAAAAGDPWPMYRHDTQHTGRSPYSGPATPALKWAFTTGNIIGSSPAVGVDGTVYIGSWDNKLYAIKSDGTLKWVFTSGGAIESSTALGADGTVYVGSDDKKLYAINPDGTLKWAFLTGAVVYSSPTLGVDGTVYVGSGDGELYAINPDGTKKWAYNTSGISSSPALGADGTVYFGSVGGYTLYAVKPDGTLKWSYTTGGIISWTSPAVGEDGTVYIGSGDNKLYAIDQNGTMKWTFTTGNQVWSSPAISANGTIYVGSRDCKIYAINPDGTQQWVFTTNAWIDIASPAIGADGTIYMGSEDSNLYAINPNGTQKWAFKTNGIIESSPALGADGTIYIGSYDNKLYAIAALSPTLTLTAPTGGEQWPAGSAQAITWASTAIAGSVKLELYKGGVLNSLLADNVANNGVYYWNIPAGQAVGANYRVKVSADADATVSSQSAADFAITTAVAQAPWPMFHHDIQRSGRSPYSGPATAALKWACKTGDRVVSSPAVGVDGSVYVGSDDQMLYAFSANGALKWMQLTGGAISSSPAIGPDGTVYAGSSDRRLYAFTPDGKMKWSFFTGGSIELSSPVVAPDGTVYIAANNSRLFALNPNGSLKWSYWTTGGEEEFTTSSPALGVDGTIYLATDQLYAIRPNGTLLWTYPTVGETGGTPTVGADGTIYVGANKLYAIKPDGTLLWAFQGGSNFDSSPALGADGTIYIGGYDQHLYAIAPNGAEKWAISTTAFITSSPAVGADGTIYFGSGDSKLYAIRPNGTQLWAYASGDMIESSPAIGADGTIYIGSDDGKLYAIGAPVPPTLTLSAPNGGEQWAAGSAQAITWASAGVPGTVKLQLYQGGVLKSVIADTVANTGIYYWTIPAAQATGTNYRVKISTDADATVASQSVADFAITAATAQTPWPMFHHDIPRSGRSPYSGPATALQQWTYTTGDRVVSSPAVGLDGTAYAGSDDGKLYAITPNGTLKWTQLTGGALNSSPAIGPDGTVYAGSNDQKLYALSPSGTAKWTFTVGGNIDLSSPVVTPNGTVYVTANDNKLYALNPDGTLQWAYQTSVGEEEFTTSSPALGPDGTIYFATDQLYAIHPNGTLQWTYPIVGETGGTPAVAADGTIYVGADKLYAFTPDGVLLWAFQGGSNFDSSPALGADGTIYIGAYDGNLYAFTPNGTQKWLFPTQAFILSSPTVGADGTIYIGSGDSKLYAVRPNGTQLWAFTCGDMIESSPAIGANGTLYVGCDDGKLYAIGAPIKPTLTLTTPNGGEQWAAGSTQTITWTSTGVSGTVKLQLYKGGALSSLIADNVANTGSYSWSIPAALAAGTNYRVKISADADATVNGQSAADFAITAALVPPPSLITPLNSSINVVNPVTFTWSEVTNATQYEVDIATDAAFTTNVVSKNNLATPGDTEVLATGTTYFWRVKACDGLPSLPTNWSTYSIAWSFTTAAATPTLTLTAPAGGEQWAAGSTQAITWTSTNTPGSLKIELYKGGVLDSLIADNVPNTGNYNWSIPAAQAGGADYRVKISADADATVASQSAADFSITVLPTAATPTFSPLPGTYADSVSVDLTCATSGAEIHYTLDGTDPTAASPLFTAPLVLTSTTMVKAIAVLAGYQDSAIAVGVYTLTMTPTVATPVFTPGTGTFTGSVTVAISCATAGATIYYTTDSTTPDTTSTVYTAPLTLTQHTMLSAYAVYPGDKDSAPVSADYQVSAYAPQFDLAPGSYTGAAMVTLTCATPGATIYYSTNNTPPTPASPVYTAPLMLTHNTLLRAFATAPGMLDSTVTSALYDITPQVATPVITPTPGTYTSNVTVHCTCATPGAQLHYTLDGSTPTENSPLYTTPLLITRSLTFNVQGVKIGMMPSMTASASYTVQPAPVATPTVTPGAGTYAGVVKVIMACATAGAEIHYTLDGNTPTRNTPRYTAPLMLTTSVIVTARAFKPGWTDSQPATVAYTLSGDAYEPDNSPAQAKPITNGQAQAHTIDPVGDQDWVKFTLAQPSDVYAVTDSISTLTLALYAAADLTHSLAQGPNNLTRAGVNRLPAGAYYLEVTAVANQTTAYQLLLATANPGQVVTPFLSPLPGTSAVPVTVTLHCPIAGAVIRYTFDGTDPTVYDPAYTQPLVLTQTTTIKAKAFKPGYLENTMAVGTYIITGVAQKK